MKENSIGIQQTNCSGTFSRVTLWRKKCQMCGFMTTNPIDNLHVLMSFNRIYQVDYILSAEIRKIEYPSHLTAKQHRYRKKKMKIISANCASQSKLGVLARSSYSLTPQLKQYLMIVVY